MRPDAILEFEKWAQSRTRYILQKQSGCDICNFPSFWIADTHPYKGRGYIIFTDFWGKQTCPTICGFTHVLSFGKNRIEKDKTSIGLNFSPEFPNKTFGEYENHAVLVQFSHDWNKITVCFFKDKREMKYILYEKWKAGELEMTVPTGNNSGTEEE